MPESSSGRGKIRCRIAHATLYVFQTLLSDLERTMQWPCQQSITQLSSESVLLQALLLSL